MIVSGSNLASLAAGFLFGIMLGGEVFPVSAVDKAIAIAKAMDGSTTAGQMKRKAAVRRKASK